MRVSVKDDPEHVPYLTLVPIGGGPDIGNRGHRQIRFDECNLETDVRITLERQQVIDDGELACWLVVAIRSRTLVDRRQIVQHAVRPFRFQLQVAQHVAHSIGRNPLGWNAVAGFLARAKRFARIVRINTRAEAIRQFLQHVRNVRCIPFESKIGGDQHSIPRPDCGAPSPACAQSA